MFSFIFWLFIGILATLLYEWILKSNKRLKQKFWDNHVPIFGYHFHHSFPGLISLLLGLLFLLFGNGTGLSLIGFGLGVILVHTYTDKKLIFFEKI